MKQYNVIGLMSGTSLDGLDVCYVAFNKLQNTWHYNIVAAKTYHYPKNIRRELETAYKLNAFDFIFLNKKYGKYIGEKASQFIKTYNCKVDFISSHGHTIFHQPDKKLTYQIGDGAFIAAETGLPVICDFRNLDVALGGQGAPLVPIGDQILFSKYNYCLNIGGFSNISFETNSKRMAYDICPANIVLNHYAKLLNKEFDDNGEIAQNGVINKLNNLDFYKNHAPKSLGLEWVLMNFIPIVDSFDISIPNKLATISEHIAIQIAKNINQGTVLITGGGVYNSYLLSRLKKHCTAQIIIPDKSTINFKEALIFALLGVLYIRNTPNTLSSVTGASKAPQLEVLYTTLKLFMNKLFN